MLTHLHSESFKPVERERGLVIAVDGLVSDHTGGGDLRNGKTGWKERIR
jgi:hypothetical protein